MNDDILLLFQKQPGTLPLYEALEARILERYPDTTVQAKKTQVSFSCRYGFAFVSPPARKRKDSPAVYVILTFGLGRREEHPRIAQAVEPYPGRWTHHVLISREDEIDRQIMGWIDEARTFAMTKRRRK